MLTGQRRGEVAGMRWEELDLPGRAWNLPKERTKNGRSHTVLLAPEAIEIFDGVRRFEGSTLVFEGPRRTVPSGFGKVKLRLDKRLAEGLAEQGRVPAPWIVHDFRRTVATGFQRFGVRLEVTEAFLNHVSGNRAGIVGIYQRHHNGKPRRWLPLRHGLLTSCDVFGDHTARTSCRSLQPARRYEGRSCCDRLAVTRTTRSR